VTTNSEGGHDKWEQVSLLLVCLFISIRNNADWFLVSLDSLARHKLAVSLESPGLPLEECLEEDIILEDSLANELGNELG
jgi:hypothetical protein